MNDRTIRSEIASGALDVDDVAERCGAGARCGGCRAVIDEIIAEEAPAETMIGRLRVNGRSLAA